MRKPITQGKPQKLEAILDEVIYVPNIDQRRLKAAFWSKFVQNPVVDVAHVTADFVVKMTNDPRIKRWWIFDGFREWFLNEDEFRQRIDYLDNRALDRIEQILDDPDANQNAVVNTIKLLFEASNKMPKKWEKAIYLDEQIQRMDKTQLESFIKNKSIGLIVDSDARSNESEKKETKDS